MDQFTHPGGVNCTQPAIDDFPRDLFTPEQRDAGAVVIHVFVSLYLFLALAVVCDKYFVPAVAKICKALNMSNDVAGATFMAAATSAPELFVNVIGTFITEGDIGIGTVVGSAVFNILAVAACCGIVTQMEVPLDWWPLTRDCLAYGMTVSILIVFIHDERVEWYEALILVVLYVVYIAVMYFDKQFQKCARGGLDYASSRRRSANSTISHSLRDTEAIEIRIPLKPENHTPGVDHRQHNGNLKALDVQQKQVVKQVDVSLQTDKRDIPITQSPNEDSSPVLSQSIGQPDLPRGSIDASVTELGDPVAAKGDGDSMRVEVGSVQVPSSQVNDFADEEEEKEDDMSLWVWPSNKGLFKKTTWIITWPINLVFMFTIPDCERPFFKKWFPLTFLMCIIWIGSLSYVVAWMITVIGDTLKIPDSVMGITFLAAGTSVPEAVSSVIVAKQGHGSMGISNSIGSNTFDILLCLGLPWFIKAAFIPTQPGHHWVAINSAGLEYSAISLLSTLLLLYVTFWLNKFKLDARVGRACLCMYAVFLILASLIELNVFFPVNLPTCRR